MDYTFMKARKGDVFEEKIQVRRDYCVYKRYVVVDYTGVNVITVCIDNPKIWRGKIRTKTFTYEELSKKNYVLLDIR